MKIEDCRNLWMAKGAGPLEKIDVPGEDDLFGEQLRELIKLVEGKESEIVTPAYGREVVRWLDAAFADFE